VADYALNRIFDLSYAVATHSTLLPELNQTLLLVTFRAFTVKFTRALEVCFLCETHPDGDYFMLNLSQMIKGGDVGESNDAGCYANVFRTGSYDVSHFTSELKNTNLLQSKLSKQLQSEIKTIVEHSPNNQTDLEERIAFYKALAVAIYNGLKLDARFFRLKPEDTAKIEDYFVSVR